MSPVSIKRRPPARPHGRLQKVITGEPLDIVAIDILSGLPLATNGSKYILVATDYFTKPPDEPSKPVTPYVTTFRSTIRDVHHRIRLNTGAVAKTQKNYF